MVMLKIVIVLMLCSSSTTLAQMPQLNDLLSPCLKKLNECYKNSIDLTKMAESAVFSPPGETQLQCCTEWSQQIKENTRCLCKAFKSDLTAFTDTFNVCNLNVSTTSMCQGIYISSFHSFP